jgi:hypothetical protein
MSMLQGARDRQTDRQRERERERERERARDRDRERYFLVWSVGTHMWYTHPELCGRAVQAQQQALMADAAGLPPEEQEKLFRERMASMGFTGLSSEQHHAHTS